MRAAMRLLVIGSIFFLSEFALERTAAQDEALTSLYVSVSGARALWRSDSLAFASQNPSQEGYSWTVYYLNIDTLQESSSRCPFGEFDTRDLTYTLSQGISNGVMRGEECVFWSPYNHYMLASGREEITFDYSRDSAMATILVDFRLNRFVDIPLSEPIWHRNPIDTEIFWSDDSTAFVVATPSLYGPAEIRFYSYVSGYAQQTLSDETHMIVRDFEEIHFNETNYHVIDIHDVSADGSMVLLRTASDRSPFEYPVFVWNTDTDTYQRIDEISTDSVSLDMGASFAADGQSFIIVDNDGIVQYDLRTGAIEVLRDDVSARWVDAAYFSPNGQSLMVFDYLNNGAADAYYIAPPYDNLASHARQS